MKNIGLFGGSFDPIHLGHLLIAEVIREELDLEKVIFIPTGVHPLKDNQRLTPAQHRLKMVELAVQTNPYFDVSDLEIKQQGISYTIDTVRAMQKVYPPENHRLFFLIGQDNVNQLHLWKDPDRLLDMCTIVAFGRPGFQPVPEASRFLPRIRFLRIPLLEISATEIRERLYQGKSVRYMVPDVVIEYIHMHRLYQPVNSE